MIKKKNVSFDYLAFVRKLKDLIQCEIDQLVTITSDKLTIVPKV